MAFQAPLHLQRLLLVHKRHLVDWTVAGIAAYAFIHVNAVIEEDKARGSWFTRVHCSDSPER